MWGGGGAKGVEGVRRRVGEFRRTSGLQTIPSDWPVETNAPSSTVLTRAFGLPFYDGQDLGLS